MRGVSLPKLRELLLSDLPESAVIKDNHRHLKFFPRHRKQFHAAHCDAAVADDCHHSTARSGKFCADGRRQRTYTTGRSEY